MTAIALLTVTASAFAVDTLDSKASVAERESQANEIASELMTVFGIVIDHHLRPPATQQMVLGSIERAYQVRSKLMPGSLSKEVSSAGSPSELQAILVRELALLNQPEFGTPFNNLPHQLDQIGVQVTPLEAQRVNEQLAANRYVGIGIAIMMSGEFPEMAKVMPGGAAALAECQEQDAIISVDGRSTSGVPLTKVIDWIRGPEGTDVDIEIRRGNQAEVLTMTRGVVPMKTISKPILSKSGIVAGVSIDRVSASNVHELRHFADSLDESVETVILDMRTSQDATNLHYGKLLGNALLDNESMGQVVDRNGDMSLVRSESGALFSGRQLRVLIGRQTGPVLKWIAAALQDTDSAILMGMPASIPSVVADVVDIPDQSLAISIPTKRLARSDGATLYSIAPNRSPLFTAPTTLAAPNARRVPVGVLQPDEPIDSRNLGRDISYSSRHIVPMTPTDAKLETVIERVAQNRTQPHSKAASPASSLDGRRLPRVSAGQTNE